MRNPTKSWWMVGSLLCTTAALTAGADVGSAPDVNALEEGYTHVRLQGSGARVGAYERGDRITTLYGRRLSAGVSAEASADAFIRDNIEMFGAVAEDLEPIGPFPDGEHLLPVGYDLDTGTFKYTLVGYTQSRDGVPVFRSALKLVVANRDGSPLVLAKNGLRDLGAFQPNLQNLPQGERLQEKAARHTPRFDDVSESRLVIWAGVDDMVVDPVLAREYIGWSGDAATAEYEKWRVIADARTGDVLHLEDLIHNVDVAGNTSGNVTEGLGADICGPESPMTLPYMQVGIGGTQVFADENGDFVIPNGGSNDVTVTSNMTGRYFWVNVEQGVLDNMSMIVTPPGPANFLHNETNSQEFIRSQSNAYHEANVVRDYALFYNPAFPVIANQENFRINVNRNSTCNATYSGTSINFYASGGGCPNTGYSTIVHHEYGHHLVEVSNNGAQGQYGEGYGDVQGVLITDDPGLAYGFFSNCSQPLRNADSNIQYPCGGPIHDCGVLIAACVWDTRNELVVTEPDDYKDVLGSIVYNAMPVHTGGSTIAPDITIDYLVMDDDDGDIGNGTPHYAEIAAGFGAHNMDAPPLVILDFDYPDGRPEVVDPGQPTTFGVNVLSVAGEAQSGTGQLSYSINGGGVVTVDMDETSENEYEATLPGADCDSIIRWWVSAETTDGVEITDPAGAPDEFFATVVATGTNVTFDDDFEADLGWTVGGDATDGQWERAIPIPLSTCDRGNPGADGDGSSRCYVTDNSSANQCNSDVDGGSTILTSPVMDASGGSTVVTYWRWYSNNVGDDPNNDILVVEVSDDNGVSWATLEIVGPAGGESNGGWFNVAHNLADVPDFELNDQFRIRFNASDLAGGSVVEAGVDGVRLTQFICEDTCVEDLDGSGAVDFGDILAILSAWGPCEGCPEDLDDSGAVDFGDILAVLSGWGACP